jgi:hypothetical protein
MKSSEIAGHLIGAICKDCQRTHKAVWAPNEWWVERFCLKDDDNYLPATEETPCKRCLEWFTIQIEE